jgi:hypothetical protein
LTQTWESVLQYLTPVSVQFSPVKHCTQVLVAT